MKYFCLIICVGLVNAQGDLCPIFCQCEGSVALCRNLPQFPVFLTTGWITNLIIIDGTLTTLPITRENFPKLTSVVLRNCRYISCQELHQLTLDWENLNVESNVCLTEAPSTRQASTIDVTTYGTDVTVTATYFTSNEVIASHHTTAVRHYALSTAATATSSRDATPNLTTILASSLTVLVLVIITEKGMAFLVANFRREVLK